MQSQIAQLGAVGKRVDHEVAGRVGDQRLAAVTDRAHARAPDDRRTEVVPGIAQANLAGVERHPHAHLTARGPGLLRERALHVERCRHRVGRRREGPHHAVARRRGRGGRVRGHVHAAPGAGHRAVGAGVRGGRRRRRHVVLEPLPRRALRRREHGVLVPVLRRSSSRSGSGPSATRRQPEILATRTTSPTGSTCAATSSSTRASRPRPTTTRRAAGRSAPTTATRCPRSS